MTTTENILKALTASFLNQGINVTTDNTLPNDGYTAQGPNGSRALLMNFVSPLVPTFQSDTIANWQTKAAAGQLPAGQWIEITGLGIAITPSFYGFCVSTSNVGNQGFASLLCADFQGVGDYSGVTGFADAKGLWSATNEASFVNGDCCVWNNQNYVVIDAAAIDGRSPNDNTNAYSELSVSVENGYIIEFPSVMFDFANGRFLSYFDKRGNWLNFSGVFDFDYGNDNVSNIVIDAQGDVSIVNVSGRVSGNIIGSATGIQFTANNVTGDFYFNIECGSTINVDASYNSGTITLSSVGDLPNCGINGNSGTIDIQASGRTIISAGDNQGTINIVCDQTEMNLNTNTGTIVLNSQYGSNIEGLTNSDVLTINAGINSDVACNDNAGNITLTCGESSVVALGNNPAGHTFKVVAGNFSNVNGDNCTGNVTKALTVGNNATLGVSGGQAACAIVVGDNTSVSDENFEEEHKCSISGITIDLAAYATTTLDDKYASLSGSNFETTVDMDGTTTLTLTNEFVGIVNLTGTGAIALSSIVANQLFPIQIQPTNQSLTVTFGQGSGAIRNSAASGVFDYTKGDYLVVQKNNDGNNAFQALGAYINL